MELNQERSQSPPLEPHSQEAPPLVSKAEQTRKNRAEAGRNNLKKVHASGKHRVGSKGHRIDFSERVMRIFRQKNMQRAFERYADEHPERFFERFVAPIAIHQADKAKPEEKHEDQGYKTAINLIEQFEAAFHARKNNPK
jgi:hypothetical protein